MAHVCRVKHQDKADEIEGPNFLAGGIRYSQIGRKADEEFKKQLAQAGGLSDAVMELRLITRRDSPLNQRSCKGS